MADQGAEFACKLAPIGISEAAVTVEVRARFALTQNAWYVASASLQAV